MKPLSRIERYRSAPTHIVAGVMSGTSLDAIDVAILEIEDRASELRVSGDAGMSWRQLGFTSRPFSAEMRARLMAACAGELPARDVFALHAELGHAYAVAIGDALAACGRTAQLDAIGLHGQTVYHAPGNGAASVTVQIGSGAAVAQALEVIVVDDFRSNDVAAGGQGAPLVPFCDYLLLRDPGRSRIALNIGGIANLTWLPSACSLEQLVAFDAGPGNMLIDAAMRVLFHRPCDFDGDVAASTAPDERWMEVLLEDEYYAAPPPKSAGREQFGEHAAHQLIGSALERGLAPAAVVATLTALSARSIARACREHAARDARIDEVIVSGGGACNATLLRMLGDELPDSRIITSDAVGLPARSKEAICFAILAHEAILERPANVPSVTGARRRVVCGALRVP